MFQLVHPLPLFNQLLGWVVSLLAGAIGVGNELSGDSLQGNQRGWFIGVILAHSLPIEPASLLNKGPESLAGIRTLANQLHCLPG